MHSIVTSFLREVHNTSVCLELIVDVIIKHLDTINGVMFGGINTVSLSILSMLFPGTVYSLPNLISQQTKGFFIKYVQMSLDHTQLSKQVR